MKNLILLSTLSIPIEYVGLFLLLMLCFIIVLEINSRGKQEVLYVRFTTIKQSK